MNLLTVLILVVLIIIIGISSGNKRNSLYSNLEQMRPYLSKSPLTPTEAIFYRRLKEALPEFVVLAQVQLSSFIKVDTSKTGWKDFSRWFNPISQQSVDFLICDNNFTIITAIELDDKSHVGTKSIERDNKKNESLDAANVPLIRWHAEAMPECESIRQAVLKYASYVCGAISQEPEWLAEESPIFLKKQRSPIKSIFVNVCLWLSISLIIMACYNLVNRQFKNLTANQLHKPELIINSELKSFSANQLELSFEKQQREQVQRQAARIEADRIRLEMIQQQNQERLQQAQEAALKQEAWERYSRKSVECITRDDMVTCGNAYIRDKAKFEKYWETQRENLKR